jgi:sortase A
MNRALRWLERLLFVVGIAALGWYATVLIDAAREQQALSRELENAQVSAAASTTTSPDRVTPARRNSEGAKSAPIAARSLIGRIEVPRLKLSALAREGVDVRTLRGSVGHVPGTALPGAEGNAAFAAHRDTFFRPLARVRTGDEVVVTTPTAVHRYSVVSTLIVDPSEVSVLRHTQGRQLTLVTCYPFDYVGSAPKRFIVQATMRDSLIP